MAVAVIAVAGAGVYVVQKWLVGAGSIDASRIRVAKVERGRLVRDVVADGRVVAANAPTLYAIAAGVVDFQVRAGDKVVKGQKLATISSPELQSRLLQEKSTLAGMEAGVGRAGLDIEHGRANANKLVAQAEVDLQGAQREVEINQRMFEHGVIPELEYRRSQDQLKKAQIALAHAHTEAGLAGKELNFDLGTKTQGLEREREVVRELERQVAALEITSPVDGQVGSLLVPQRASVAQNAGVVTVVDLSAFELELKVPDSFARDLALGMPAEITANGSKLMGKVRSVSPEVVDGSVLTRVELGAQRPENLRQNQRMTARIVIDERPDVLKVERGPFLESGGGNSAYFVEGSVAEKRSIRVGAVSLEAVEIVSGAKEGDQIVVSGADAFGTSQRARIAN